MDGTMDGTAQLLESDRRFLVHPLHHPEDHKTPLLVTEGRGAMLHLADGREVIDGLAGLWNVNVGHGRGELADAAAGQMRKIAYASAYVGATNEPAIRLGEKIVKHAYGNSSAVYYTTGGAELNQFAFKTARFFWKVQDKPEKTKFISRTARLSRRHDGGDERDRHGGVPQDVRPAGAGFRAGRAALSRFAGRATRSAASAPPRRSSRRSSPRGRRPSPA